MLAASAAACRGTAARAPTASPTPTPHSVPADSPAARESRLLRAADATAGPPSTRPSIVPPIPAEARRQADATAARVAREASRREPEWPAFEEGDPPPGPAPPGRVR